MKIGLAGLECVLCICGEKVLDEKYRIWKCREKQIYFKLMGIKWLLNRIQVRES
jgi:hypothetical protein